MLVPVHCKGTHQFGFVKAYNQIITSLTAFEIETSLKFFELHVIKAIDIFEKKITFTGETYGIAMNDFVILSDEKRYNIKIESTTDDELCTNADFIDKVNGALLQDINDLQKMCLEAQDGRFRAEQQVTEMKQRRVVTPYVLFGNLRFL